MKYVVLGIFLCVLLVSCASSQKRDPDMILDVDPFVVENLSAGIKKEFSSDLRQRELILFFHPRTNKTVIEFKFQKNTNRLFMKREARAAFKAAVKEYLQDYADRNLDKETKRYNAEYGTAPAVLRWGLFSVNAKAKMDIRFGYTFLDGSPYFTLTLPGSPNDEYPKSRAKESVTIVLYFTRAQAKALSAHLKQEFLLESLNKQDIPQNIDAQPDSY